MDGYSKLLQAALDRGEPLDASLAALRQQGASLIEAVKAVREVQSVSLSEAKRLVEASSGYGGGFKAPHQPIDEFPARRDEFSHAPGNRWLTIRDIFWLTVVIVIAAIAVWMNLRLELHNAHLRAIDAGQQQTIERRTEENERLRNQIKPNTVHISPASDPKPSMMKGLKFASRSILNET